MSMQMNRRGVLRGIGLAALLAMAGCAGKVQAERETDYPLEQKTTYAWATDEHVLIQLGEEHPGVRTKDNEARIRDAVDRALGERGLTKAGREEAELLVAFSVGTTVRYRIEGGAAGTSYGGMQPGAPQTKGTLNIYLIDREQAREVWHGWTSKWLSKGEDPDAVVNEAVAKIMAAYPGSK